MGETKEYRQMAEGYRGLADICDKIADAFEDETLEPKEREKKIEVLLGEMIVKAMKMQ